MSTFAVVINLEPAASSDPTLSIAGDIQSQKLAVYAISYLQSLPAGDLPLLYYTVVHSLCDLTGYDRVMVYKFHNDEHGEVLAESKRPNLEPYISLHYLASPRLRGSSSSRTGLVGFRRESDPGRGPRSASLFDIIREADVEEEEGDREVEEDVVDQGSEVDGNEADHEG
ncbi:hypothetical protein Fmac_002128 [Flemingia macrophylla]|uniref:Phytochrome chromophore attachment site domain-containing protein n=1 Tax=Flemingia macrophylla TaxID=520843 RepID=A0ABD1NJU6_9FABA